MISPVCLRRERCRKVSSEYTIVTCWESALSRIRVTAAGQDKIPVPQELMRQRVGVGRGRETAENWPWALEQCRSFWVLEVRC